LGTVDCARHNMKLPNGVGDLQKGERYINMDFLFFSTLRLRCLDTLNISYDIACQWHKHLWTRMSRLPVDYHQDYVSKTIRFFVPKFHLPAHISKCQTTYSFNWSRWVGRTDGEAPERGWSNINPVASSTKEMGPGSRRDTLDDHFGDWNWKKVVGLGASLLRKMKEAKEEKVAFQASFEELDSAITGEHRSAWTAEVERWEDNTNDPNIINPFEPKCVVTTQAGARLKLVQIEAKELETGLDVSLHPELSPSILISSGLDLEEDQRRISKLADGLGVHATDMQRGSLQLQRNALHRRIEVWRKAQVLYMPVVQVMLSEARLSRPLENAEDMQLFLPSALQVRTCDERLRCNEWELRLAQAHDTLEELRQCLRIRSSLLTYKKEWVRGQGANTRAQNALQRVTARQGACTARYRAAWDALNALAGSLGKERWHQGLMCLRDDDIRPLVDLDAHPGQGRRRLTWIWTMTGVDLSGDGMDEDGVRVEWCKARARAMRWSEEVELLQEEMRRVLQFFGWQATWWDSQKERRFIEPTEERDGLRAYAARQASLRHDLRQNFSRLWKPYLPQTATVPGLSNSPFDLDGLAELPDLSAPPQPIL
ncbi:hypothetical protein K503DRAFT_704426, partial [Rhizopogon vinicolor AM-OR11-026]